MGNADPRKLGGSIAGPGGPFGEDDVVVDTTNAVILDYAEVAVVSPVRDGEVDDKSICALLLYGRVNKTPDRVQVLFMMNEDGVAALVTQLAGLADRAGWGQDFLDVLRSRLDDLPTRDGDG